MPIPYFSDDHVTIYHGDCREILPQLTCQFDSCITDPPYHLTQASRNGSPRQIDINTPYGRTRLGAAGFMGKTWDGGDVAFRPETWLAVLDVMKFGAMLMAFGGTRTSHRLTCAIEDGGFEIRDTLMWLYGSGFPKSLDISCAIDKAAGANREVISSRQEHNICRPKGGGAERLMTSAGNREVREIVTTAPATEAAKLWDGYGTALKPAYEPIILGMKPLDGTFADNALTHGVAGLNIDGGRIGYEDTPDPASNPLYRVQNGYRVNVGSDSQGSSFSIKPEGGTVSADPLGRWPANLILDEEAARVLDSQSGVLTSGANPTSRNSDKFQNTYQPYDGGDCIAHRGADAGGASRFFYTAKADSNERGTGNTHPTVKPLDLMRYLCKLICPPTGGILLDPFMGSGSTLVAGRMFFDRVVGCELEEQYCEIAAKRLSQEVLAF